MNTGHWVIEVCDRGEWRLLVGGWGRERNGLPYEKVVLFVKIFARGGLDLMRYRIKHLESGNVIPAILL